jgi:hypothetical protein
MSQPTKFTCTITYDAPGVPATYSFSPAITATNVHPSDTMSFVFTSGMSAVAGSTVKKAVLIAGWKEASSGSGSSPFTKDSNDIDLTKESTLTIGTRMGKWGFVVSLSTVEPSGMTHFYFLPDPELTVTPGG